MHLKFGLGGCSEPVQPLLVAMLVVKVSAFVHFISPGGFPFKYFTAKTNDTGLHLCFFIYKFTEFRIISSLVQLFSYISIQCGC